MKGYILILAMLICKAGFSNIKPDSLLATNTTQPTSVTSIFNDLPPTSNHIEENKPFKGSFTLLTDQDLLATNRNEDRNYTMGFGMIFTSFQPIQAKNFWNKNYLVSPFFRKMIEKKVFKWLNVDSTENYYSIEVRAAAFTPLAIEKKEVVIGDRPFAMAINYGSSSQNTKFPFADELKGQYSVVSSFYIGVLGTNLGNWFQTKAHENHWAGSTRPIPQGWHNQISNKKYFPPVFLYRINRLVPLSKFGEKDFTKVQLSRSLEGNIGYYTNIGVGLNFRLGLITDRYYQGQGVGSGFIAQRFDDDGVLKFQAYFFANPKIRVIGYNALLQGRLINDKSVYKLKYNEMSKILFEFDYGLMLNYKSLRLAFIPLSLRTSELKTSYKRTHFYGTAYLSFSI